jgi:NAD-dependent deacetylase
MKKKLVVFTGSGISKQSGISTFRDSDGLWEKHKVEDIASLEA